MHRRDVTVRERESAPPADEVRERVVVHDDAASEVDDRAVYRDGGMARERTVVHDPAAARDLTAARVQQVVWLVFGIVSGMILLRILLRAFGANPDAGFAEFVYGFTAPLVAPFVDLFGNPGASGMVLELGTIVAFVFYLLLAWVVAKIAALAVGRY